MTDTYVECLVKTKARPVMTFLKYLTITLAALIGVVSLFILGNFIGFLLAFILGVVAYFISINSEIEYEYLYLDKEISVDKIMSQTRRKKVATYEVDKMQIFAPINSYKLDEYKNQDFKVIDYSSGIAGQPDQRYVLIYEGQMKVILEPSEKLVKAVYNVAPRKVFTN